jgi:hypothetical protein
LDLKHCLKARLLQLLRKEEMKWYERSKSEQLLQGENDAKYFMWDNIVFSVFYPIVVLFL